MTVIPIVIGPLGIVTKELVQGTGGLGNKRTSGDHAKCSMVEMGHNNNKSPGDLRQLAINETPVEKPS